MLRKVFSTLLLGMLALFVTLYWCYSGTVTQVDTTEKVIALTYDDGPNPPHTAAMLKVLGEQGVRATFFLKGANVEAYPEEAARLVSAGHEIANHSWYHRAMWSLSRARMLEELQRTNAVIRDATGVQPALFRPPYGAQGPGLKRALTELGMPSVLASSMGSDWNVFDARAVADAVLETVKPGGIILLHDGHGDVDSPVGQDSRAHVVEATAIVVSTLKEQGYRFVTVGELLALAE